jgi:hypothetical protein
MKSKLQTEMKPSWNQNHIPNRLKFMMLDTASTEADRKNNESDNEIDMSLEVWEEFRSFNIHG